MSLQPSSHPKARSLIVFLLFVISLRSLLTQFTDIQDKVCDLPRRARAVDEDGGPGPTCHHFKIGSSITLEFEWPVGRAHVKSDFKIRALSR